MVNGRVKLLRGRKEEPNTLSRYALISMNRGDGPKLDGNFKYVLMCVHSYHVFGCKPFDPDLLGCIRSS